MTRWIGLVGLVALAGCATSGQWERVSYELDVRGHPTATVMLESPPYGNVVEAHVEGDTAKVSVRYRGEASVEPVGGARVTVEKVRLGEDSLPLVRAWIAGKYRDVEHVLEGAGSLARDDLSRELLLSLTDAAVASAEGTKAGRRLLDRLLDELTSGHVGTEEARQAHRILAHRAQRVGLEAFIRAVLDPRTRIFPIRRMGVTVLNAASPKVRWEEDGSFGVTYSAQSFRGDYPETKRLDFRGERVGENEIIGIKLYDEGGRIVFGPGLMLVQHANAAERQVLLKIAEMAALGLSAGLSGAVARVTFLVWCDRVAIALGVLTSVIDEHRGWILARYGEAGARFLFYSDVVSSAVALYGVARVVTAAPRLVRGLRDSYARFKAADGGALKDVERVTEEVLSDFEGAAVIPLEEGRPPMSVEEPLQATGTEGVLVRLSEEGEGMVASLRRGAGPNEPLRPAAPGSAHTSDGVSGEVLRLTRKPTPRLSGHPGLDEVLGREPTPWEEKLFRGRTPAEVEEMSGYLEGWAKRTYQSEAHSVYEHAYRKGYDPLKLLRKVAGFNRRGARRVPSKGFSDRGTYRLEKGNGEYLLLEEGTNKVVTYGEN